MVQSVPSTFATPPRSGRAIHLYLDAAAIQVAALLANIHAALASAAVNSIRRFQIQDVLHRYPGLTSTSTRAHVIPRPQDPLQRRYQLSRYVDELSPAIFTSDMSTMSTTSSGTKRKRGSEMKFYAVRAGHVPAIYHSWTDCKEQITGFKGAICKSCLEQFEL